MSREQLTTKAMHIILFHFYSKKPNPVYQELAAALREGGHTVLVGAPNEVGDLVWDNGQKIVFTQPGPNAANYDRPQWAFALLERLKYLKFMWHVVRFLQKCRFDVVQVNPTMFAVILPLLLRRKMLLVQDIRQINEQVDKSLRTRLREKRNIISVQFSAQFVYSHTCFCHQGAAERILGKEWTRKGSVVPVGVDDMFNRFERVEPIKTADTEIVRFIYVGTLDTLRNLERIILAAKKLFISNNAFCIDFVGPDTTDGYYHQLVENLNLGSVVKIKSPIPYAQVPSYLDKYHVGLAYVPDRPTWHYQPTIKALEYRALGLPILSTNVTSHREIVEHEKNGLLIEDSIDGIASALHRFVTDRDFLYRCEQNALEMRQGITWRDVARQYEEKVYRPLLSRCQSRFVKK